MEALGYENSVIHGNGARMDLLADGQADLVFTSPPYFPDDIYEKISVPREEQTEIADIENQILSFARTLRPVFKEIARVLKPGRALVIQTKDIRYGDFLIPLSDGHLSVATSCGFHLVTQVFWTPSKFSPKRLPSFLKSKRVGQFRAYDSEAFLVLTSKAGLENRGKIDTASLRLGDLARPLWRMPFRRRKEDHPFVSPRPVVEQLLFLLSEAGDLVVDPFAGYGTILDVAKATGRLGVGWDVDVQCVNEANRRLS